MGWRFIHSIVSVYYVAGTVPSTGVTEVKTDTAPAL